MKANKDILLKVRNLCISTASKNKRKSLVKNISFEIKENEIIGLLGESGSGKSLTSLAILSLLDKNKFKISGEILFHKKNLLGINNHEMLKVRGSKISMIFQEPMSALNPTMKISKQLFEVYKLLRSHLEKHLLTQRSIHELPLANFLVQVYQRRSLFLACFQNSL